MTAADPFWASCEACGGGGKRPLTGRERDVMRVLVSEASGRQWLTTAEILARLQRSRHIDLTTGRVPPVTGRTAMCNRLARMLGAGLLERRPRHPRGNEWSIAVAAAPPVARPRKRKS